MEELLPVGSVVQLSNNKVLMVIGYFPSKPTDEEYYDYICCKKNFGLKVNHTEIQLDRDYYYIKKEDIQRVLFIGYSDEKFDNFSKISNIIMKKVVEQKDKEEKISTEEFDEYILDALEEKDKQKSDENEE